MPRSLLPLVTAATVLLAAGCSSDVDPPSVTTPPSSTSTTSSVSAPTAEQVVERARDNAVAATSAAFKGRVSGNGSEMLIDYRGSSDGSRADVTVSGQATGGRVRILTVPEGTYMQADAPFWTAKAGAAAAGKYAGRWVAAPAQVKSMSSTMSLSTILGQAFGALSQSALDELVGEETIDGVPVWVVTDAKGRAEGALYVSKATFELVRFTGSSSSPGQLDFSQWNADLGIKAPSKGEIVPLS